MDLRTTNPVEEALIDDREHHREDAKKAESRVFDAEGHHTRVGVQERIEVGKRDEYADRRDDRGDRADDERIVEHFAGHQQLALAKASGGQRLRAYRDGRDEPTDGPQQYEADGDRRLAGDRVFRVQSADHDRIDQVDRGLGQHRDGHRIGEAQDALTKRFIDLQAHAPDGMRPGCCWQARRPYAEFDRRAVDAGMRAFYSYRHSNTQCNSLNL